MRVYFDKKNIVSFFASSDHTAFQDCLRMIKSQCDIYFTFPKECFANPPYSLIFNQLTSGRSDSSKPKFIGLFPPRPLKFNIHKDFDRDELTAVYLINDEKIDDIINKGYLLIGDVGEEIETISKLIFEDYQFSKNLTPKLDMRNWDTVGNQSLPCTDIIITDKYVFNDPNLLDNNIHYLLKTIGGNYPQKKLNIVIFTSYEQEYIDSTGKKQRFTPDWEALKSGVKSYLKNFYGATSNVTLITLRHGTEHDRIIFSNYNNHHSGDSLNYFDSKWNFISNGRHYTIFSHGYKKHLDSAYCFIDDMQAIIDRLVRLNNTAAFVGDKKSNFLKFPD